MCDCDSEMIRKIDPVNGQVTLVCEECGSKERTPDLAPDPTDSYGD